MVGGYESGSAERPAREQHSRKPGTATLLFKHLQHVMYNMTSDEYIQCKNMNS